MSWFLTLGVLFVAIGSSLHMTETDKWIRRFGLVGIALGTLLLSHFAQGVGA